MSELVRSLNELLGFLQRSDSLEATLQAIVGRTARLLGTDRVSIRLLDPSRSRLLVTARHGEPLHVGPQEFKLGEGLVGWIALHVRPIRTDEPEADPRFVPRPGRVAPLGPFLGAPLVSAGRCLGVITATRPPGLGFSAEDEELLSLVAGVCAPFVEIGRLSHLLHRDPLTGTLNRRGLDAAFPSDAGPMTVVMADVDHFKRINDEHGHLVGDAVLQQVASLLSAMVRGGDAVVRYGGEEFLLLLPGIEAALGVKIAERARRSIEATPILVEDRTIAITMSFGVAGRRGREARESILSRADHALYTAKQRGRNRVEIAP